MSRQSLIVAFSRLGHLDVSLGCFRYSIRTMFTSNNVTQGSQSAS
jgi:hypothetical protein